MNHLFTEAPAQWTTQQFVEAYLLRTKSDNTSCYQCSGWLASASQACLLRQIVYGKYWPCTGYAEIDSHNNHYPMIINSGNVESLLLDKAKRYRHSLEMLVAHAQGKVWGHAAK